MSRKLLENLHYRKHLVIHMDINKTIIQEDKAGGRSFDDVLNSNVAANVFGRVDDSTGKWIPLHGPYDSQEYDKDATITYDAYVDKIYSKPDGMDDLSFLERKKIWKSITDKRKEAVRNFTLSGSLGESFAHLVELQRERLKIEQVKQSHQIIPSFFHLINVLSELNWPFTLVFRTFGNDLPEILSEWKDFVMGNHACKPSGPILEKMKLKIENASYSLLPVACIYRVDQQILLCKGIYSLKGVTESIERLAADCPLRIPVVEECCRGLPGFDGVEEITYCNLSSRLMEYYGSETSCGVGGLVDHYDYWASSAECRDSGKVFPVHLRENIRVKESSSSLLDRSTISSYSVFFDDNIFWGDPHSIVDIRDERSAMSICSAEIEKMFCVPVNAFKAIVDMDYFVNELVQCILLQEQYFHQMI